MSQRNYLIIYIVRISLTLIRDVNKEVYYLLLLAERHFTIKVYFQYSQAVINLNSSTDVVEKETSDFVQTALTK